MDERKDRADREHVAGVSAERARSTAFAAGRVAELAAGMAGEAPENGRLDALRDAQAAAVLAEEAVNMSAADPAMAKAVADEALSMASGALSVLQAPAVARASENTAGQPVHAVTVDQAERGPKPGLATEVEHEHAHEHENETTLAPSGLPVAESAAFVPASEPSCSPMPLPLSQPASASCGLHAKRSHAARNAFFSLLAVLFVAVGLAGAAWLGLFKLPEPMQSRIELLPDVNAKAGRLNATESDVPPGSFQLVLNQVCTMESGSLDCPIAFENPEANGYSARLDLSVGGRVVAGTNMVAPGWHVTSIRLDEALPVGEHQASATVQVYSGATQVNTLSADVTIRVK